MQVFNIGDMVRHKLYGELLRIKRITDCVATCEEINKAMISNIHGQDVYPVRICSTDNLIHNLTTNP